MCGISGIIDFKQDWVQEENIRLMMQAMKHRGPDDEGVFIDNNVGLGFVRLSIIDLSSAGHQPMYSHDKRYVIVFNGEIFNYLELRAELIDKGYKFYTETDTEVLINSYIAWGEECQHKLNGMWSFMIYDREAGTVFISRDRYGIKPFYYVQDQDFFAFASEIPPLLKILSAKPKANSKAIFDFLVYNRTDQSEFTFFDGIKKLQHGHCISLNAHKNKKGIVPKKWYDLKKEISKRDDVGFTPGDFRQLFSDAIKLRLRSDVPVGVCFSGGLDSSAVVSTLLYEFKKTDLNTFSAVYEKGTRGDESEFIDLYSGKLNNMYFTTPSSDSLYEDLHHFVKTHAEPIPGTSPFAQYLVMKLATKHVVVTLDGQGADEILAGYHYFFGFFFKELFLKFRLLKLIKEIYYYLKIHRSFFALKSFIYFLLPAVLRTKMSIKKQGYLSSGFIKSNRRNISLSRNLFSGSSLNEALINHFEYKLEHLLKWEDRNSMAFSIEARTPFLDYRLVESTLSLKGDQVIKKGMTKFPLRSSFEGVMPEEIRLRADKVGFETPQDEWFRSNTFQQIINDILNSESFKKRNIIDPDLAKEQYKKHLSGELNIAKEIWKWVHLELWFREFID